MNEEHKKVKLNTSDTIFRNGYVKPKGKWWKRYFSKKVRKGGTYKRMNWWHWN